MAKPMTSAPPTTATTSFQTPLVALATPCCKLGSPPSPVPVTAGAPRLPPVTGASTTVTEVCVLTLPSGRVKVDRIVELDGRKETSSEEATSTVTRPPVAALPPVRLLPLPLFPGAAEMEKTTRPLVVAMGVAEGGVETGTACVVGALVAVVREETGRTMPSDVCGGGAGDWASSVADGEDGESDSGVGESD